MLTNQKRKSCVPRRKTLEELHAEAKERVKDPWRGTSMKNDYLSKAPILRPKLLNPWEMAAALGADRAATKNFLSKCTKL